MFWNKCSEKMPPVVFKSEWCDSDEVRYGWYESDVKIAARRDGEIVLAELLIEYDTKFGAHWRNVSNDMVLKDVVAWANIPKLEEVE